MKTMILTVPAVLALIGIGPRPAMAHCQMPCGIYDDELRFRSMREDVHTIEKAMTEIAKLSTAPGKNANQITRWVLTKEEAANRIATIMAQYFLQQRITVPKPGDRKADSKYVRLLKKAHLVMVKAMMCKRSTDQRVAKELGAAMDDFWAEYGR